MQKEKLFFNCDAAPSFISQYISGGGVGIGITFCVFYDNAAAVDPFTLSNSL